MTDERLILAIGRLERALSRIETAVAADPVPRSDPFPDPDHDLAERHTRLRATTAEALARLDRLLDL